MAGIYIPGMEMPNKKNGAVLIIYPGGKVFYENGRKYEAIPVPPHGRLIDADAVFKRLQKQAMSVWGNGNPRYQIVLEVMDAIRFAPTIIEAEEGEA